VVDGSTVWVSGTGGSFARTGDGGKNWQWSRVAGCEDLDFRSIAAFSDKVAVIANAGSPATILKTVDGGASWKKTFADDSGTLFFDAMAFWDGTAGICLGDPLGGACCMLATDDAGETWSRMPEGSLPGMAEGEAHFAASGTCIAAFGKSGLCFVSGGLVSRYFRSADRGKSWLVRDLPLMHGTASRGAFSVVVIGERDAAVVGGDYAQPELNVDTVAWTADGGLSWQPAAGFPPGGYNSCIACAAVAGDTVLVATGTQGSHASADGGRTWTMLDPEPFNAVAFGKDGSSGWAVGTDGRVSMIVLA